MYVCCQSRHGILLVLVIFQLCKLSLQKGALAIEIMEGDEKTANLLQCLHHSETALKIVAERAFMKTLDGGCSSPIAVNCELQNDKVFQVYEGQNQFF